MATVKDNAGVELAKGHKVNFTTGKGTSGSGVIVEITEPTGGRGGSSFVRVESADKVRSFRGGALTKV